MAHLGPAIWINMTVEAGSAKGACVGPKVPVPTVNLPQLGLVARHYPVLVLLVGRPHTAGCDIPAWRAADRASPQCLQQHLPAFCCTIDAHRNTSQCPSSCIRSEHTQHTLLPSSIFHTIQLCYGLELRFGCSIFCLLMFAGYPSV